MGNVCEIYGKKITTGGSITRRGLAKKVGGIGTHVVKNNKRKFKPNIQKKRYFLPELNIWVSLKLSTKAIRTIDKKGIMAVLREAKAKGFFKQKIAGL